CQSDVDMAPTTLAYMELDFVNGVTTIWLSRQQRIENTNYRCIRSHVEAKLLQGMKLPECPHEGYKSRLDIESCLKFLTPKSYEIMILREKEASIPAAERVYCPFSNCSYLMSEAEVLEYTVDLFVAAKGT
nr:ribonuclease H domain-containing protein [Tanacetum cinerariifolium]